MKLYIVHGVLRDYSAGMLAVKAASVAEARQLVYDKFTENFHEIYMKVLMDDFDLSVAKGNYFTLELSEQDAHEPGVVTMMWGGD